MTRDDFREMNFAEQGMILISKGKHLTQIKKGNQLLNLYSVEDFFVEVYYSVLSDKILKIEVITDLSRIDQYIEERQQEEKLSSN
ncbi:MAG TPA: hypothetical protein DCG75_12100 [Bacteroidales bacterium]|jgi:hypothetical protein|nr:hypothetical protein [Bacteroidales bacterium]